MPFDEALAVADSALRSLDVSSDNLLRRAAAVPVRHRARCMRVALAADARAANPFESVLRAIALQVPDLSVEPQVWIGDVGRPDLVDEGLRIVLRFAWEHVMFRPDYVRTTLVRAVEQALARSGRPGAA